MSQPSSSRINRPFGLPSRTAPVSSDEDFPGSQIGPHATHYHALLGQSGPSLRAMSPAQRQALSQAQSQAPSGQSEDSTPTSVPMERSPRSSSLAASGMFRAIVGQSDAATGQSASPDVPSVASAPAEAPPESVPPIVAMPPRPQAPAPTTPRGPTQPPELSLPPPVVFAPPAPPQSPQPPQPPHQKAPDDGSSMLYYDMEIVVRGVGPSRVVTIRTGGVPV